MEEGSKGNSAADCTVSTAPTETSKESHMTEVEQEREVESPETSSFIHTSNINPGSQEVQLERNNFLRYLGLLLTLLSALTFSFNVLVIKLLKNSHPFNLGIWTFLFMTICSVLLLVYEVKVKHKTLVTSRNENEGSSSKMYLYLCARALFGTTALIFFFYASKYLNVADALVIDSSSPIFVYLMAYLFLREEIGFVPVFTAFVALLGVTFICRPPFLSGKTQYDMNNLIGAVFAFLTMLCIATSVIFLRFLENVHIALVSTTFGAWGTLQSLLMALATGVISVPMEKKEILLIIATCGLFTLGQVLLTVALQYEEAGPVGLVRTSEVLFIFVWQYLFLGTVPDIYSYIGALLVSIGVVILVFRKWVGALPATSPVRNSFCKLLLY